MARDNFRDILAFLTVAREKNFTKAAAKLGVSQSALSHTIRALETRMGLRLLTRTTRSVSPTDAGERLLNAVGPHFQDIQTELDALSALADKPSGNVRITAGLHVTETILWPRLQPLLRKYPDVHIEIIVDYGLANIVADRFDAGVRLGEQVARDMVAVRIGPDFRMVVVAAPSYFSSREEPRTPQDLTNSQLYQPEIPYLWRDLRLGVRERRTRDQCSCRWTADFQFQQANPRRCAGRVWPGLSSRGYRRSTSGARPADPGARSVVRAIPGLSHLLPESPTILSGVAARGRCAAVQTKVVIRRHSHFATSSHSRRSASGTVALHGATGIEHARTNTGETVWEFRPLGWVAWA